MGRASALLTAVIICGCTTAATPEPVADVPDVPPATVDVPAAPVVPDSVVELPPPVPDAPDVAEPDAGPVECPALDGPTVVSAEAARASDAPVALASTPGGGFVALWARTPDGELVVRRVDDCAAAGEPELAADLSAGTTPVDPRGFDLDRHGDGPVVAVVAELQWSCDELCEDGRCKVKHLWSWHRHTLTWWPADALPGAGPPLAQTTFETEKTNALYSKDASGCIALPPTHPHTTSRMTVRVAATPEGRALLLWDDTAAAGSTPGAVMGRLFDATGAQIADLGVVGPAWTYLDSDVDPTSGYVIGFRDGEGVGLLRLDADGAPREPPVHVFAADYTDHGRVMVHGLPGSGDRAVLAFGAGLPGERDVYVATMAGAELIGEPVRVHLEPEFDQHRPAVAGYADGGFEVFWEEAEWPLVMRRRFDATGLPAADPEVAASPASNPGATSDGVRVWGAWLGKKGHIETPGPFEPGMAP